MKGTMNKWLVVALLSAGWLMLFGSWTVARAAPVDFTFFDGTNPDPDSEGQPDGGAECHVSGAATLHASVTNHLSGNDGYVRLTYQDGDWVQFPIKSDTTLQLTQAIGNRSQADRKVRLSARDVSGNQGALAPKLVGAMSAISLSTSGTVECRSCKSNDPAGDQDPPTVLNQLDCHNAP